MNIWALCLWFWSKSVLILSPLSACVANDVSGRWGQEWCSWAYTLVTVPVPMLDCGQAQKAWLYVHLPFPITIRHPSCPPSSPLLNPLGSLIRGIIISKLRANPVLFRFVSWFSFNFLPLLPRICFYLDIKSMSWRRSLGKGEQRYTCKMKGGGVMPSCPLTRICLTLYVSSVVFSTAPWMKCDSLILLMQALRFRAVN